MGLIGHSWRNDPTPEEKFEAITGFPVETNLAEELEERIEDAWISNSERSKLRDLQSEIRNMM